MNRRCKPASIRAMLACFFTLPIALYAHAATFTPPAPPKAGGSGVMYYVSSGSGNDANAGTSVKLPFKTISKAASLVKPGDVVNVMNGTYTEQVYLTRSGSAEGGYITYQAYPGAKPLITKYKAYAAFNFSPNEAYIIVDGFKVVGDAQDTTPAQAQELLHNTSSTVNNGDCITAKGNHIVIRNNELSYCPGAGLGLAGDYMYAYNNTIHHNAYWSPAAKSGLSILGKDSDSSTDTKIWVYNNIVYQNKNLVCNSVQTHPCRITDGEGIIADSNNATNYHGRTLIYNNVTYNNGGPGIEVFLSRHVDVVNNTTYMNNLSAVEQGPTQAHIQNSEITVGRSSDVRVLNNIMYSRPGAPILYVFQTDALEWDYNLQYAASGQLTGVGTHNVIADPLLRDPARFDFSLRGGSPGMRAAGSVPQSSDGSALPRMEKGATLHSREP